MGKIREQMKELLGEGGRMNEAEMPKAIRKCFIVRAQDYEVYYEVGVFMNEKKARELADLLNRDNDLNVKATGRTWSKDMERFDVEELEFFG